MLLGQALFPAHYCGVRLVKATSRCPDAQAFAADIDGGGDHFRGGASACHRCTGALIEPFATMTTLVALLPLAATDGAAVFHGLFTLAMGISHRLYLTHCHHSQRSPPKTPVPDSRSEW